MLTLRSGASSIVVAPEHGAALTGWMWGNTPILRRALPQASVHGDSHAMGCFPLLPYGNRIGHRRFRWLNREYQLAANFGDQPHSIHGIGWQRAWTVSAVSSDAVTLSFAHQADAAWPFAFRADVGYRLTDCALTVTIALTNRHPDCAPGGIGLHPYFPKTYQPALRFEATGAWHNGADALPLRQAPPPADWRHDTPRSVAQSRLDNCFTGWSGIAEIHAGPASLRMEACQTFPHLQVFTPSWTDFFCVEPVSHVPDALNRPDVGAEAAMRVLKRDETLAGTIRLTLVGG